MGEDRKVRTVDRSPLRRRLGASDDVPERGEDSDAVHA
jgi:hypothetical protein